MSVETRAYAAVTGLLLGFTMGAAPAAAQQASLVSDSLFILRAGSIGLLQAKLAKLAERKGSSEAVVEFGKRMTADYSKANDELAAGGEAGGLPGARAAARAQADRRAIQWDGPFLLRQGVHGRGDEAPQ